MNKHLNNYSRKHRGLRDKNKQQSITIQKAEMKETLQELLSTFLAAVLQ